MTALDTTVLNLLGKEVSFSYVLKPFTFQTDGTVTSIVFNLHGEHEFSVDDGDDFYSFSEVLEFKVLDAKQVMFSLENALKCRFQGIFFERAFLKVY